MGRSHLHVRPHAQVEMEKTELSIYMRNFLSLAIPQHGVPLSRLDADFFTFSKVHIPLGAHADLEALLNTMPDICHVRRNESDELAVFPGKSTEPTAACTSAARTSPNRHPKRSTSHITQPDPESAMKGMPILIVSVAGNGLRRVINNDAQPAERGRANGVQRPADPGLANGTSPPGRPKRNPNPPRTECDRYKFFWPPDFRGSIPDGNLTCVEILAHYAEQLSLPPPRGITNPCKDPDLPSVNSFLSSIEFNKVKYKSYPDYRKSPGLAEEVAAYRALEKLDFMMEILPKTASHPENQKVALQRIESVVSNQHQVLQKKRNCDSGNAVLRNLNKTSTKQPPGDLEEDPRATVADHRVAIADILQKNDSASPMPSILPKIPPLTLSTNDFRIVNTCVINANNFYGSLVSDAFDELVSEMTDYYTKSCEASRNSLKASKRTPLVGGMYAVLLENTWYRVKCIEEPGDSMLGSFFFVDLGSTRSIAQSNLYQLVTKFYSYPFFSINFLFDGFVDLDEANLNNAVVIAELERLISRRRLRVVLKPSCDPKDRPLPVKVFSLPDDSSNTGTWDDVNALIYRLLATPVIPVAPQECRAFLSYVSAKGVFFLQIEDFGLRELHRLKIEPDGAKSVRKIDFDRVYCAKLSRCWCRCVVKERRSGTEVGVEFIDHGIEELVSVDQIFPLRLSGYLAELPPQAVKTHLTDLLPFHVWTPHDIAIIRESCHQDKKLFVNLTEATNCKSRLCDKDVFHVQIRTLLPKTGKLASLGDHLYEKMRRVA